MKAFEKAFETGTDGIELDIHLTKDKRIVICHDYDIEPTSNGKGLISEMTYDELYRFDFGEGEHIPLLSSLLERNFDFKLINIEIKVPKDGNYDICRMTAEMLDKYDSVAEIIISSFGLPVLTEYKKYDSKRKTGILPQASDTQRGYIEQCCRWITLSLTLSCSTCQRIL